MGSGLLSSFRLMPAVAEMLREGGLEPTALLEKVGLSATLADAALITAPLERLVAYLDLAADSLGTPTLGLDLGVRVSEGTFGLVEFVMRSAPTVEAAMALCAELVPLINTIVYASVTEVADGMAFMYEVPAERDALGRHMNEYVLMMLRRNIGAVMGEELPLVRAWFAHGPSPHAPLAARRLGCDVTFAAPDCGMVVPRDWLDRRPPTADAALFAFLADQARTKLADVDTNSVVTQTARCLEQRLATGEVGNDHIAAVMGLNTRTLQRRLAEAGTTYRKVLRHVRLRRHAELVRAGLDATAICARLGFATVSSMRRFLDSSDSSSD